MTTWQTDGVAYKLKPRSFHKSTHLQAHLMDFHLWCEPYLIPQPNIGSNIEVAKLQTFNREAGKVLEFLIIYRLYIRMRMREAIVEKQI